MSKSGGKSGGKLSGNPRADVKNPNNPAHKAAADNRSNQINPKHPTTSKGGKR